MTRKLIVMLLSGVICLIGITSALAITYNEAPMLRTKVAAGELPPVEERLPEEPFVAGPGKLIAKEDLDLEIGQYGGTLRAPCFGDVFPMNSECIVDAPGILAQDVGEGIVKGFDVSEDGKVLTFHMREGLKWSDGYLVTTEDVFFTYEDFLLNKKLTPVFPQYLRTQHSPNGEPMKLEVIDDYTFRIRFAKPYPGFPSRLARITWTGYTDLIKPKHYLKQFHPRYTPLEELEPLIKEEGLSEGEWWTLFNLKDFTQWEIRGTNPAGIGFPVLYPWMKVKETPLVIIFERNPYYWKVDTEGKQLPYIDRIRLEITRDIEMMQMKVLAGEVDYLREMTSISNVALYKENEKKGGYRTVLLDLYMAPVEVHFNLTYPDPVWRKIVRDIRFRKALSLAINRDEIIDNVYFGFAKPTKFMPSEYNPEEANRLLDEVGLDKKDAKGWRLGPDGKRFVVFFEFSALRSDYVPVAELVKVQLEKVGIQTTLKVVDLGLLMERGYANEVKATLMQTHMPLWWGAVWANWGLGLWGWPLWEDWVNTGGKKGEEPPAKMKKFLEIRDRVLVVSPEERQKIVDEYYHLIYENMWFISLVVDTKQPVIVNKNLGNIPRAGFNIAADYIAELFFFRK